jgi:hypothetical protein
MHTSNQGLIHTFKFSAVLIICSLLRVFPSLCSLPAFPFPRSLSEAVSGVCGSHESPTLQICAFTSLLLPSPCSPPSFPIDNYVPALFPYWRLGPRPLSLLTIMLLLPFPIFDYAPSPFPYFWLCLWHSLSLMSLCYFYKIVGNAILCSKYLSEQTGQLLFMHRIMFHISTLFLMQKSPLWKWVLKPS